MDNDYRHLFKIVLVGDSGVGKTSLLLRYSDNVFDTDHIATIGVDFKVKNFDLGQDNGIAKLQIWDTAGQDRFKSIVASFYRGTDGLIVVYDVTDMTSFEHVKEWFGEVKHYACDRLQTRLLIGNKADLTAKRVVSFEEGQALAKELDVPYLETSAKDTTNVTQAFTTLAHTIFELKKANPALMEEPNGRLNLPIQGCKNVETGLWKSLCSC